MTTDELQTASEVVDALGGPAATGRLTGRTPQAACNWKATGKLPAELYLLINKALEREGKRAPAALFGMARIEDGAA